MISSIKKLFRFATDDGLRWFRQIGHDDWRRNLVERRQPDLSSTLRFFNNVKHIEALSYDDSYDSKAQAIVLRPPDASNVILPALAFDWSALNSDQPCMTLELGLFIANGGNIQFIGYRYETPECNRHADDVKGSHDYYHSQPIIRFRQAEDLRNHSIDWLPDDMPASPLIAKNPFDLFISMLVGLHGLGIISKISRRARLFGADKDRLNSFPEWT